MHGDRFNDSVCRKSHMTLIEALVMTSLFSALWLMIIYFEDKNVEEEEE